MKYINRIILLAAITLTSCMKLELEDLPIPPEPTTGNVTLVTDWTNRGEGIAIPSNYTVEVNNQTLTFEGISSPLPELEAGTYPVLIYNSAENITIDGTKATVKTENNTVDPSPGWLFTSAMDVVYEAGEEKAVTATMVQQVRQLNFELTIIEGDPESIVNLDALLSGVANTLDIKTSEVSGNNLHVIPLFHLTENKLISTVRLLGITERQEFSLSLTFSDGRQQILKTDLTDELADFNNDKHKPVTLSAELILPAGTGFEATITAWKVETDREGIAW